MNITKKLGNIILNEDEEIFPFSDSLETVKKYLQQNTRKKRIEIEQYKQISLNCIQGKQSIKTTTEHISSGLSMKVFLVVCTALLTYYGLFYISLNYLQTKLDSTYYNLMIFLVLAIFTFFLGYFIWEKDFGKTQFMIYTIVYMGVSFLGVLTIMIQWIPITSYQILNLFVFILIMQILIFYCSTPLTRKIVCRVDVHPTTIQDIHFDE